MDIRFVYLIKNKINEKVYVGSTKNLEQRWRGHLSSLRIGKSFNMYLQEDWDKYGEENFEFIFIEEDTFGGFEREQYWMDLYTSYDRDKGYNISPTAGTTLGRRHREDSKKLMAESHTGKKLSDETRRKMSDAHKGKKKSPQHIKNAANARRGISNPRCQGSKQHFAKLNEDLVVQILTRIHNGELIFHIAKEYNVYPSTLYQIKRGKTWRHIKRPWDNEEAI